MWIIIGADYAAIYSLTETETEISAFALTRTETKTEIISEPKTFHKLHLHCFKRA